MQNVVYVVQKKNTLTPTGCISSSSIIGVASTESEIKKNNNSLYTKSI